MSDPKRGSKEWIEELAKLPKMQEIFRLVIKDIAELMEGAK